MRVVHAAALTAAALLLASVASAQGLGDAAARGREAAGGGEPPAGGGAPAEDPAAKAAAEAAKAEEEARAKAIEDWRKRLDPAQKEGAGYQGGIRKLAA